MFFKLENQLLKPDSLSNPKKYHKLSVVLQRVKDIIYEKTKGVDFWVTAEISNINFHKSGHCYIDLSETEDDKLQAQCKAIIWSRTLYVIEQQLGSDTRNVLKSGNEILFNANVAFSEIYGFSLEINSVDLSFSLGNVEKQKQEAVKQLTQEGLINLNKQKPVPSVIQKIALIGSPNTSGFTDFREQLLKNQYNYHFSVTPFPCSVQGDKAEAEIISCFNNVKKQDFDIVALIRGGGSKLDLEIFNSINIAKTIAKFNIPVWTGIGHETDHSVCDLVANLEHKTPSALASHIVEMARNVEVQILTAFNQIRKHAEYQIEKKWRSSDLAIQYIQTEPVSKIRRKRGDLHNASTKIVNTTNQYLKDQILLISDYKKRLASQSELIVDRRKNNLKSATQILQARSEKTISTSNEVLANKLEKVVTLALQKVKSKSELIKSNSELISAFDPKNILAKGYSIVRYNGQLIADLKLKEGDELEIQSMNRSILASYLNDKK
ncbi:exodeoxyribonuclease VII large subunit [Ekhidna sp.]|uniref:exodeoxyribonuclease VII large subunit n=1 Tax=Ekhidna sp. TaxID=2608089 RepID=UPI003CCC1F6B